MKRTAIESAKWIWLNKQKHPELQKTFCTIFADRTDCNFCIAEFVKRFFIKKEVAYSTIYVSGDTKFRFWINEEFIGVGPVAAGGDYDNKKPMPKTYYSIYNVGLKPGDVEIYAEVQLSPEVMTDYSNGHGGFILSCEITYKDGTSDIINTDDIWKARVNSSYLSINTLDETISENEWEDAQITENIWTLTPSAIPNLNEEFIPCSSIDIENENRFYSEFSENNVYIKANSTASFYADFDKIYSGYVMLHYVGEGKSKITITCQEIKGKSNNKETLIIDKNGFYRGFRMQSIGGYQIIVENQSDKEITLTNIGLVFTCYPVFSEGSFNCSEELLNKIYNVGKWTLKICRQSLHLDSPLHQETLGCTGDYFIESLINYYTYGDPRLTRLDIVRTADFLRMNDGAMFHTSYSLIWVQLLTDYYRYTGDISIFNEVIDALHILLKRFHSYVGENELIENAPNYMFIDWVNVDGFNMHHPPKALGQTCLNAFYYKALIEAAFACNIINDDKSEIYQTRANSIKEAINKHLWDNKRQLYFDGLNTPDIENRWKPKNTEIRYFSQHANVLFALYGLADEDRSLKIMKKVVTDETLIKPQPYFMHYVLEAIYKVGLYDEYGLLLIRKWKVMTDECDKGMREGWGEFNGDYSHAWGTTPTYQLPSKILGLKMIEPGYKKISLDINLFGLDYADIIVPTPYGDIIAKLKKDQPNDIQIPEGISLK